VILSDVIEGLVEERGLEREKVVSIVCEGIQAAYGKKYPQSLFFVSFNRKTGTIEVFVEKTVSTSVSDEAREISLRRAKSLDATVDIGSIVRVPFEKSIGRIEILAAKQFISSKIRDLEYLAVYNDFKDKKDNVVTGVIHKRERLGTVVKVGEVMAILPRENSIASENLRIGHPIKALLKEVFPSPHGDYQLILDRASAEFARKLLELEIPEIFEGLVEVKKIVRIAGYKTKAVVAASSKEIDPVGTCVGVGGSRIKPILRELGQEKIDLIEATDSIEELVKQSLKPADVDKVEVVDDKRVVVWLAQDQRSFAIGKLGQNISLASKLVGMEIQLQDLGTSDEDSSLCSDTSGSEDNLAEIKKEQNDS
jgi:N utilization substance protein A